VFYFDETNFATEISLLTLMDMIKKHFEMIKLVCEVRAMVRMKLFCHKDTSKNSQPFAIKDKI
jgi:hypothetical protein